MKKTVIESILLIKYIILILPVLVPIHSIAQGTSVITGIVFEEKTKQPVPHATIRLSEVLNDTTRFLKGTISDEDGVFFIKNIDNGTYHLQVTSVGYKLVNQTLECRSDQSTNIGNVFLQDSLFTISEFVVVADRIKGKSEINKTIYFINTKMLQATGGAPELLRHVPGVQVDLKHHITLNGQSDILFFVDGKERDKSYLSQLDPSQIDKIEVLDAPPSNYDGNASGVINIILKKQKVRGLSGHLFSEIPVSTEVVYLFPTCGINYTYNKINLYTSYNGEINYENIDEIIERQIVDDKIIDINSVQHVKQKNLSHKFHYGVDYYLSKKNVFSFYGFYNRYSYEQDGSVIVEATDENTWKAHKDETDQNQNFFHSLYFNHQFEDERKELTVDINNAFILSENNVAYISNTESYNNIEHPRQLATGMKVDFTTPLNHAFQMNTGVKSRFLSMNDKSSGAFSSHEQIYAFYGGVNYKSDKYNVIVSVRLENSVTEVNKEHDHSALSFLPYFSIHYKANMRNAFSLSYRSSINRPTVYQLNAYSYYHDPYTLRKGNPLLRPEYRRRIQMEYATRFASNFVSAQLFYETIKHAMNKLTSLNDHHIFVTQTQNLGDIHQYGLQLKGALKFGIVSITPSVSLYKQSTYGNSSVKANAIENKNNVVFTSGISSVLTLKNNFALSVIFQYATAKENIQDNTFCDALYFISLDKTFQNNLKIGIVSALPLTKTFVYQGSNIYASNFSSKYTGNLKLPTLPFMFRVNYQFSLGKSRNKIDRIKEKVETRPKSGF